MNTTTAESFESFTAALSRAIQKHKKTLGISLVRQSYKGTGSNAARRQLWIRFNNDKAIDIWLEEDHVSFCGVVCQHIKQTVPYGDDDVSVIAESVAFILKANFPQ